MTDKQFKHEAVLATELVESLNLPGKTYVVDCTAGGGGHLAMVLSKLQNGSVAIAIDRDPDAIEHLTQKFQKEISAGTLKLVKASFSSIESIVEDLGLTGKIDAIYADLGVSSHQLDTAERGFSFSQSGPLDMRMAYDGSTPTAAQVLNERSEAELADIFYLYGEIRESRRLARKIVEFRKNVREFANTADLVEVVSTVLGPKKFGQSHPSTRVFQALRIEVNQELEEVRILLDTGWKLLGPKGRFAVISFHSLEDRMVKQRFAQLGGRASQDDDTPREIRVMQQPPPILGKIVKPFPAVGTESEISANPRARSAKLRVIEKIEQPGVQNV